jgi:hypothetical protein
MKLLDGAPGAFEIVDAISLRLTVSMPMAYPA